MILTSPEVIPVCKARLRSLQERLIPFVVFLALGVSLKYATSMRGRAIMIYCHYLLINVSG